MFIINNQCDTTDAEFTMISKITQDCASILQKCSIDTIQSDCYDLRQLMESEGAQFNQYFGLINVKHKCFDSIDCLNPFRPVYSNINNDAATTKMIDIFCAGLNRNSIGQFGFVSARNAWFEQYQVPRAITVNLASCQFPVQFQREIARKGEQLAICCIAFLMYLLPAGATFINSKCKAHFGSRDDYLNNKYPYEEVLDSL